MKKMISIVLSLALLFSLGACSKKPSQSGQVSGDTITITDHNGDSVTLPAQINRIVVCDILPLPSVLSVLFDSAEKLVGISSSSMSAAQNGLLAQLYPELLNAKTDFINGVEVNTEELAKLEPDVVFYNASSKELGDSLKRANFNAVAISVNKWNYNAIETLNNWIELLSQIFPANQRADAVRKYSDDIYALVQQRTADLSPEQRAKVFFLFQYNDSTMMTSGKLFFGQWWAEAIGAVNAAEELSQDNSVSVNLEQIYTWNPNLIFITNFTTAQPQDLYDNTIGAYDWSGVAAVRNKAVYKMPLGMYRSYTPGADTPITLLWLAKTCYPSLFDDIDITQEAIDYYQTVFDITLTQKQVESIFAPVSNAGQVDF